jgi:hypothetical protein
MNPDELSFFRRFLKGFFDSAFVNSRISSADCHRLKSWATTAEAREYGRQLFRDRIIDIPQHRLRLQLKTLREMDGREFNHIEIHFIPDSEPSRTKCFVGHRFLRSINDTLRWNLRQVLEPYNVEIDWSGRDIRSVQILDNIFEKIKGADFCIFDNRATQGRPNVYIEVGMCFAVQKPFILFEHESVPSHRRSGGIPSDLASALAIRYRDYRQLFREFYFQLPVFFEKNLTGKGSK